MEQSASLQTYGCGEFTRHLLPSSIFRKTLEHAVTMDGGNPTPFSEPETRHYFINTPVNPLLQFPYLREIFL
jgi:hypothetical protein